MRRSLICLFIMMFVLTKWQTVQAQYALNTDISDTTFLSTHSPHKATFYSAVVPGLGQIYNQKYWKVPILYAGLGGLIYYTGYNNSVYKKYFELVRLKKIYGGTENDPYPNLTLNQLVSQKDTWRRYRDLCVIGIGLLYVAQIIDADVDAHLFEYDITEDLSMNIQPVILETTPVFAAKNNSLPLGLRCSFRF